MDLHMGWESSGDMESLKAGPREDKWSRTLYVLQAHNERPLEHRKKCDRRSQHI
jgi:hypothetical protein